MTRTKGAGYVGSPAHIILDQECSFIAQAFGEHVCYLVGSALDRPDFRDVDVRLMLADEQFKRLFGEPGLHESNRLWAVLTIAVSERLSRLTGLRVDFQVQDTTRTNEQHPGPRSALGIWFDLEGTP